MTRLEEATAAGLKKEVNGMGDRDLFLKYSHLARAEGRNFLLEHEAAEVCRTYQIPSPEAGLAHAKKQAVAIAERLGYPVVLKVVSPQVLHKSDVGGVRIGVTSRAQVIEAYDAILENVKRKQPDARVNGVTVAKMAGGGIETIIGLKRDETFGPVVMFGIGGVNVEVYADVTFRLCPVGRRGAEEMLDEIRGRPLLDGFRGGPKASVASLKDLILAVCAMGMENPEIGSVDLNPVWVDSNAAMALDARIVLQ